MLVDVSIDHTLTACPVPGHYQVNRVDARVGLTRTFVVSSGRLLRLETLLVRRLHRSSIGLCWGIRKPTPRHGHAIMALLSVLC